MCSIFQSASSPELNPVEHVWEDIREKYLHTPDFPSLDEYNFLSTASPLLVSREGQDPQASQKIEPGDPD